MLPIQSKKYNPKNDQEHHRNIKLFLHQFRHFPQIEPKIISTFAAGVYLREMHMKANNIVFSLIHKQETIILLVKGHIKVFSREGLREYKSFSKIITPPGTQRIIVALEDSILTSVHPAEGRTEKEIVDDWAVGGFDAINNKEILELNYEENKYGSSQLS